MIKNNIKITNAATNNTHTINACKVFLGRDIHFERKLMIVFQTWLVINKKEDDHLITMHPLNVSTSHPVETKKSYIIL